MILLTTARDMLNELFLDAYRAMVIAGLNLDPRGFEMESGVAGSSAYRVIKCSVKYGDEALLRWGQMRLVLLHAFAVNLGHVSQATY